MNLRAMKLQEILDHIAAATIGDDVANLKEELEQEIVSIKRQLDGAIAQVRAGGEHADPIWFARAQGAKRCYGVAAQRAARKLSELRKAERALRDADNKNHFHNAVRATVDAKTYADICALAAEMQRADGL